jgi:hypothetical protein
MTSLPNNLLNGYHERISCIFIETILFFVSTQNEQMVQFGLKKISQPKKKKLLRQLSNASLECATGLPDGILYFQTKSPNLGKFWRVLQWKMLVYCTAIWYIFWPIGIQYMVSCYVHIFPFWYVVPRKIWQSWCATRPHSHSAKKVAKQALLIYNRQIYIKRFY